MDERALIETEAVGERCRVGPFSIVKEGVTLGDDVTIGSHVVVEPGVTLSDGVEVLSHATVGVAPRRSRALAHHVEPGERSWYGPGVIIGTGVKTFADVEIGENTLIGDRTGVREMVRIGAEVVIGTACGLDAEARVGDRSKAITRCVVTGTVGEDVFLSAGTIMVLDNTMGLHGYDPSVIRPPEIGDRARVGAAATILPGVEIGEDALVGAGAVVTRSVAPGALVMGVPARVVARGGD